MDRGIVDGGYRREVLEVEMRRPPPRRNQSRVRDADRPSGRPVLRWTGRIAQSFPEGGVIVARHARLRPVSGRLVGLPWAKRSH
jgi:hypothetical protein